VAKIALDAPQQIEQFQQFSARKCALQLRKKTARKWQLKSGAT
jgi:hypothetical protein